LVEVCAAEYSLDTAVCQMLRSLIDRTLHLMVAHHDETVVDALIRRLERDGVLHDALHICNLQHQVGMLCFTVSAVFDSDVRIPDAVVQWSSW